MTPKPAGEQTSPVASHQHEQSVTSFTTPIESNVAPMSALDVPTDWPRHAQAEGPVQRCAVELPEPLVARVRVKAAERRVDVKRWLAGVWGVFLSRLATQDAFLLGARDERGECRAVALRVDAEAPFDAVLARLAEPSAWSAYPASATMRSLADSVLAAGSSLEAIVDDATTAVPAATWTIALQVLDAPIGLRLAIDYRSDLFEPATVAAWLDALQVLVAACADQTGAVGRLPLLDDAARQRVIAGFNDTGADFPPGRLLHELVEQQVLQRSDAVAVEEGGERLSYAQLEARANQLAHRLIRLGVRPDDRVAVVMERSTTLIVALLGILKAGAGYVPVDPEYPADRREHMLADSQPRALVCAPEWVDACREVAPGMAIVTPEDWAGEPVKRPSAREAGLRDDHVAYVIYTSGSTGKPKGVVVEHRQVVNYIASVQQAHELVPSDRVLQFSSVSFDAAVEEIFGTLASGATLVLRDDDVLSGLRALGDACRRHGLTVLPLATSYWHGLVADLGVAGQTWPASVRLVVVGGEAALPAACDRWSTDVGTRCRLLNLYGPTEATVTCTRYEVAARTHGVVPIGRPVHNTSVYVLDEHGQPVPVGFRGEIHVGGTQVARGYLGRDDLTSVRFLADPFAENAGARMYRTGDIGRWRSDGNLEYIGRNDTQVKVRGHRIELSEVESRLGSAPGVRAGVAVVREDVPGVKRLVAYVSAQDGANVTAAGVRAHLKAHLPEAMLPSTIVVLPALPLTPNGKVDRRALPKPDSGRPDLGVPFAEPQSPSEAACCLVFARLLELDAVGRDDSFFDLGGNSMLAMRALETIATATGVRLSPPTIFARPTPAALAAAIDGHGQTATGDMPARTLAAPTEPIAIIGMAGRFPGATTVEELWDNLLHGRDCITTFTPATLDPSVPAALRADPNYVAARGVVAGVDQFDASFFGISAREAEVMDPQHRLFLEVAWECLERAGYAPDRAPGRVGVFAGVDTPTYLMRNVLPRGDVVASVGDMLVAVCNDKDYVATRVANRFDLRGPAIAVNTACSTSLVALAQAVDSLRAGRCTMALAGGASVQSPPASGYLYVEGAMLSPDGHTRTFDASAQGTAFNDGAAVVLLKRLSDAIADGDMIHAVVRGVGLNNDGGGKASFTAPSVDGQSAAIAAAHDESGVDPATITYVEAHGTATPLGDPVEIEALTRAFRRRTAATGFCRIGSVKSNVGHLVTAAGATGLIKTALALQHERIPPTIHFGAPNPHIPFAESPFVVCDRLTPWPRGAEPRRAGVSSFGVGGTNAHAVIEEAPLQSASSAAHGPQLLRLSAKTAGALAAMAERLAARLQGAPDLNLADVAYTLRRGRSTFAHRLCVVASTAAQAVAGLRDPGAAARAQRTTPARRPDVVLLFPGQGAQYAGMGKGLYAGHAVFRQAFDEACAALTGHLDDDLRALMDEAAADALTQTARTQPATFCLEYALARLWLSKGLQPVAMIGHSVGEFAAAVIAGVMSLQDAARLVALRGRLMQALPAGSMLSVRAAASVIERRLPAALSLAADNAPNACVVAGPGDAVEAFRRELDAEGVVSRALVTSHAFHSSMMDPCIEPFERAVAEVRLAAPRIPIISSVTGDTLSAQQATSASYWARHLREPVRFSPALRSALSRGAVAFVEVGPRATLSQLARLHAAGSEAVTAVASLADSPGTELEAVELASGHLWTLGVTADAPENDAGRRRVLLPTYPFERKRVWLDPPLPTSAVASAVPPVAAPVAPLEISNVPVAAPATSHSRRPQLKSKLAALLEDVAGVDLSAMDPSTPFVEIGLDSLTLTQAAQVVKKSFGVNVTFRQLMETHRSLDLLVAHLDETLPPEAAPAQPAPATLSVAVAPGVVAPVQPMVPAAVAAPLVAGSALQQLIAQQMQLMAQQLALLGGAGSAVPPAAVAIAAPAPTAAPAGAERTESQEKEFVSPVKYDAKKAFGAIARIHTKDTGALTPRQREGLDRLVQRYVAKTQKSKRYTESQRDHMADPRVVNGFRPQTKEIVYQLVIERSKGARMWDIDGNEYVDALGGFGMCLFGWQPDFVQDAVRKQLDDGYDIGPMHPLAGEVCRLVCELSGCERAALVNTGSEAVMGAIRIARTATARNKIVSFSGSYHGTFDEVLVRAGRNHKGIPAAPGIMPGMFGDIMVLEYGTPEALEAIRRHADDIAAVLVEPVQSRRPEFQPREFLHQLRELTSKTGVCLIFDEVITGFRSRLGGAQEFYGIRADLCTYGKVIGGGMPIGVIAGKREFMDALDGGHWQYGDDSMPTVGVTYLAGTFVRHPLALAAAKASLEHLKAQGPALQERLNLRIAAMADELNAYCREVGAPLEIRSFASLWRTAFLEDHPWQDLLFAMMRTRGVHILDNFPCYGTTALGDDEIATIKRAFKESIAEMQEFEFLPARAQRKPVVEIDANRPPVPGARLGRDESGNPAWYVAHPEKKGKFLKVDA